MIFMADFTGMSELISAVSSLISVLVVVILVALIGRHLYIHREKITEYIRNQNLKLSRVGFNSVLNFEFIPVETEYGEMSLATSVESYSKPTEGFTKTVNYFDSDLGFKISWREDIWMGCPRGNRDYECLDYSERLEEELTEIDEFRKFKRTFEVPIFIRRMSKSKDKKMNIDEHHKNSDFIEYVYVMVDRNLPIEYSIRKPNAAEYSKLKKDFGKLNDIQIRPQKDIYDYLNELPFKKDVTFKNIVADKVEPCCTAFLEQELTGESYNPITNKPEKIEGKYTQFQKILINKGKAFRIIAVVLPRDDLKIIVQDEDKHKVIQDEVKFIMNSFKLIESDTSKIKPQPEKKPRKHTGYTRRLSHLFRSRDLSKN